MAKAYSYIRFSKAIQARGDSLRRQLERSREYAARHGLELDESLIDAGLSAYTGENADTGMLGAFIEAVKGDKVAEGSVLIVESLDRLSRQQALKALYLLDSIVSNGVDVVVLADGEMRYTQENIGDVLHLMYSIMQLSRAHAESQIKSDRATKSWINKRKLAEQGIPLTRQCPNWVRVIETDGKPSGFEVIPEAAATVKRIFDMTLSGFGQRKIATTLNTDGVPHIGKSAARRKGWNENYIRDIQRNRTVIGELQLKSKGEPVGEPVRGYYPAIIDEGLFFKAQKVLNDRINHGSAGRRGERFSNLLSGMCKCDDCGATARLVTHRKSGTGYYVCTRAHAKKPCGNTKRWRWRHVEAAALFIIAEHIDWTQVYGSSDTGKDELESSLVVAKARLHEAERRRDRFESLFVGANDALLAEARAQYANAIDTVAAVKSNIIAIEGELASYIPAQRQESDLFEAFGRLQVENTYSDRAHVNGLLKQAGLELLFGADGVTWSIGDQRGMLINAENEGWAYDHTMLAAAIANANYATDELKRTVAEVDAERSKNY